jgi:mannose-6-phosphate isomerase-like protein (cupin superfamily)
MSFPPSTAPPSLYPPPAYHGPTGEVSATLRRADAPPELDLGVGSASYLATGATTGGHFGLYRWDMGPARSGPPAHFHRTISESFYVLVGTVRIFDGAQWFDAGPGDFAHVPPGGLHAFENASGEPASMLLHFSPGAPREQYFERLPELASMSGPEMTAFFQQHDNHWV